MSRNRRWRQITVPLRAPGSGRGASSPKTQNDAKTIWNGELTYDAYGRALEHLIREFPANYLVSDIPQILSQIHRPKLIVRHDVVGALEKARVMAKIEHGLNIRATYLIRHQSSTIGRQEPTARALAEIRDMGHEIGLNFVSFPASLKSLSVEQYVQAESLRLSQILGAPVCSVSFTDHQPELSGDSLFIGNLVNASSPVLMKWSLLDTEQKWTISSPSPAEQDPDRALLQLVVQPASWEAALTKIT
jgi:hypothetical protein